MCMCSQAQENKIQKGWELRQEFTEKNLKLLLFLGRFLYLKLLCGEGCVSLCTGILLHMNTCK